jgi:hypothetical protein
VTHSLLILIPSDRRPGPILLSIECLSIDYNFLQKHDSPANLDNGQTPSSFILARPRPQNTIRKSAPSTKIDDSCGEDQCQSQDQCQKSDDCRTIIDRPWSVSKLSFLRLSIGRFMIVTESIGLIITPVVCVMGLWIRFNNIAVCSPARAAGQTGSCQDLGDTARINHIAPV